MTICNAHGVFEPDEVIRLPFDQPGWRGVDTASIELAQLDGFWIWAASYSLMRGEMTGSFEPLKDSEARRCGSRSEALHAAQAYLRERMARHESRDAGRIRHWLDNLQPVQGDLFSEAA